MEEKMVKTLLNCPACERDYAFVLQYDNPEIRAVCGHCGGILPLPRIIQCIIKQLIQNKRKRQKIMQNLIVDLDLSKTKF
jgi:hypothetical protein